MFQKYKLPIIGSLVGLILMVSFIQFGFFKTILVILFTLIGGAVGFYLDKNQIVEKYKNNKK